MSKYNPTAVYHAGMLRSNMEAHMLKYIPLFPDMEQWFEDMDDPAIVGRLIMAALKYNRTGEEPTFSGNDPLRYCWGGMRSSIVRSTIASEQNAANAKGKNGAEKEKAALEQKKRRSNKISGAENEKAPSPISSSSQSNPNQSNPGQDMSSHVIPSHPTHAQDMPVQDTPAPGQTMSDSDPPPAPMTETDDADADLENNAVAFDGVRFPDGLLQGPAVKVPGVNPDATLAADNIPEEVMALAVNSGLVSSVAERFRFREMAARYPPAWIQNAVNSAVDHKARSLSYVMKILKGYEARGSDEDPDTDERCLLPM